MLPLPVYLSGAVEDTIAILTGFQNLQGIVLNIWMKFYKSDLLIRHISLMDRIRRTETAMISKSARQLNRAGDYTH